MSIHHHLDDASLMRYATGDLDPAFAVVVASHLAMCDECRNAVRLAEAVGGDYLDQAPVAALSNGSFERLSRMIDADGETQTAPPAPAHHPPYQRVIETVGQEVRESDGAGE